MCESLGPQPVDGGRRLVLVRLGEVTIKSRRTRSRFERLLVKNIRSALRAEGVSGRVVRGPGRIYVYTSEPELAVPAIRRVFGVKSVSVATEVRFSSLNDLVAKAEEYFKDAVRNRVFAVRARRTGEHDFTSLDVERALGEALRPYSRGVNLTRPEVTVYVEIRGDRAFFFTEIIRGYGGLPIGSEGKVVALVSGGFDSAVAAWYMLRRGAVVEYLLCSLGGPSHEQAVIGVLKVLAERWSYGYRPRLHIVDFKPILDEILAKCERSLLNVLLKRYMYRAAEALAEEVGAEAIVTGESLGQVASQTLRNLYVSSQAVSMPVFRPLIGMDKDDIVEMAREIGTYSASARVREYCGTYARKPKTHAELEEVLREEEKIDPTILDSVLRRKRVVDLLSAEAPALMESLEVTEPPPGAVLIDMRSPEKYSRWHAPGAVNMQFSELLSRLEEMDKDRVYVLYCDEGGLSLEAARIMREYGFKAYSLRGGARKLGKRA